MVEPASRGSLGGPSIPEASAFLLHLRFLWFFGLRAVLLANRTLLQVESRFRPTQAFSAWPLRAKLTVTFSPLSPYGKALTLRPNIIDRYIVREVVAPFAMGVGLLTFALVTGRLLKLTELVINRGLTLSDVFVMMALIMPAFLEMTFPMAVLLGTLLGFGRLSAEQELTAALACGIGLHRLALPVMGFALVVYGLSSWFAFSVSPWANRALQHRLYQITETRTAASLDDKVFNRNFRRIVIYVDHVSSRDSSLHGVLISDARDPSQPDTIIASRGILVHDRHHQEITLRLFNGSIYGVQKRSTASHVTGFRIYDLNIHPGEDFGFRTRAPDEMRYSELKDAIAAARARGKPDYDAECTLAGKYTVPLATLLFALLGVALGTKPARGGHSERLGVSIAFFFLYYSLMKVGETLAERGHLGALVAMSMPDILFAVLALWLFRRAALDRADQGRGMGDVLWDFFERIERRRVAA